VSRRLFRQAARADHLGKDLAFLPDGGAVLELDHRKRLLTGETLDVLTLRTAKGLLDELVLDTGLVKSLLRLPAAVAIGLDEAEGTAMQLDGDDGKLTPGVRVCADAAPFRRS
jgi:hypothetical protein